MIQSYFDLLTDPAFSRAAVLMAILWAMRIFVFPALVATLLVRFTISLSHRYDVLARPSDRGSHSIPTPRLGGLGSAAAFYITSLMLFMWEVEPPLAAWRLTLLLGGAWALIGGALDDFQELPPRWKLLLQLAAVGCVPAFGFAPSTLDLPFGTIELGTFAATVVAIIVTLFLMNIFNFMDGMDGQASVFGIVTGLGLAVYLGNHGVNYGFGLHWDGMYAAGNAAIAAGTLIGLLIYNYPGRDIKSKTFLGDCGSQFYGFILAVVALQAGDGDRSRAFPWLASLILFSPFIYDVAYTLVRRIRRGEKLTQAHRTHLYQRLMVAGWTHGQTLKLNLVLYFCMMVLSWLYAANAGNGFRQLGILLLTGALLAAYTGFVIRVERTAVGQIRTARA